MLNYTLYTLYTLYKDIYKFLGKMFRHSSWIHEQASSWSNRIWNHSAVKT